MAPAANVTPAPGPYRAAEQLLWRTVVGELPTERFVRLPLLDVRVRLLEIGQGPTLLFVHGGPSAASKWAHLVRGLAGFRCVLLERPGCGLSQLPPAPCRSVRQYVTRLIDDTLAVLDEAPVAIVASSFGSYAALAFSVASPSDAPPLVHLGCPALIPKASVPLPLLLPCLPLIGPLARRLEPPSLAAAQRAFRTMGHSAELTERADMAPFFGWYAALIRHTPTRANDQTLFGRVRPGDLLSPAELARLTMPSSYFWGTADRFGGADVARALAAQLPHATFELVPHAGHLPWLDAPERAAGHVRSFLATVAHERSTATVRP